MLNRSRSSTGPLVPRSAARALTGWASRGAAEALQRWSQPRAHCRLEGLKQGGAMWWRKKAHRPERPPLRCSFCNKLQDEVPKLIAGPGVFICDECVEVCNDIIADDERFEK